MPRVTRDLRLAHSASRTGLSPPQAAPFHARSARFCRNHPGPHPPRAVTRGVWARTSSIASTKVFTFVFSSSGYLDVSVRRVRPLLQGNAVARIGSPHSDTRGSRVICTSPRLFAACRVFHRLLKPRHPPSALLYFLCPMSFFCQPRLAAWPLCCPARICPTRAVVALVVY